MEQILIDNGGRRRTIHFKAEVPTFLKPVIAQTIIVGGEKFYICQKGKKYVASVFDKVFGVIRGKILKKNFRPDIAKVRNGNVVAI